MSSPPCEADIPSEALRTLARRLGVETGFYDAFGTYTDATRQTLELALEALGIPAAVTEDTSFGNEDFRGAGFCPPPSCAPEGGLLTTCLVHRSSADLLVVPVFVPEGADDADWKIGWENAEKDAPLSGTASLVNLPLAESTQGVFGVPHSLCKRLEIPLENPSEGYHTFFFRLNGQEFTEIPLIIVPDRCWLPNGAENPENPLRLWGMTCQVYGLRRENDGGFGDITAMADLGELVGKAGGDVLGINPLHALFLTRPTHASPYSPNSRFFLNPLYIDPDAIFENPDTTIDTTHPEWQTLRKSELIDLEGVVKAKMAVLRHAFDLFQKHNGNNPSERALSFSRFVSDGGERLENFALFQTLSEDFCHLGTSWKNWPQEYQAPWSSAMKAYAVKNRARIDFHLWCQFEAERQLEAGVQKILASGQTLGLYRDLALGSDPSGADSWMAGKTLVEGISVGAPPDPMNALGQNWGFSPFHPWFLKKAGYQPFRALLQANMRHAGALRIDHILGLMRLFCVPAGLTCKDGFYLQMPFEDLLGVLCLESQRAKCLVIGEDLGTVPDGFRDIMAAHAILSSRVFLFERYGDQTPKKPGDYPRLALVSASTHDLATLCGYWNGRDLAWKNALHLFPTETAKASESDYRLYDRPRIANALTSEGLPLVGGEGYTPPENLVEQITTWTARTPSLLVCTQIEDVLGELEQVNLPGTVEQHPNWRRRLPVCIDNLKSDGRFGQITSVFLKSGRGRKEQTE